MNRNTPQVGCWYKDLQQGTLFEVVAIDELEQTIETQLIDGAVGEYDYENWKELSVEEIDAPEDWRNAYELSNEDYKDPDDVIRPEDWSGPVNVIESDIVNGMIDDL